MKNWSFSLKTSTPYSRNGTQKKTSAIITFEDIPTLYNKPTLPSEQRELLLDIIVQAATKSLIEKLPEQEIAMPKALFEILIHYAVYGLVHRIIIKSIEQVIHDGKHLILATQYAAHSARLELDESNPLLKKISTIQHSLVDLVINYDRLPGKRPMEKNILVSVAAYLQEKLPIIESYVTKHNIKLIYTPPPPDIYITIPPSTIYDPDTTQSHQERC